MKLTVVAWIGSGNLGDDLIFGSLVTLLKNCGIKPEDITAISINPDRTAKRFGVESVSHFDFIAIFRALHASDVVVFGGGGLIQDDTSTWNLPYYYSKLWLARLLGKKIVTIGVGIGPLNTTLGRWLTKKTFNNEPAIIVRDQHSKNELARLGIHRAVVGTDLAFGLQPTDLETKQYIAVSLRPFATRGRMLPVHMRRVPTDEFLIREIATALDELIERTGLAIRFVSFESETDGVFHAEIAKRMTHNVTFSFPSMDNVFEQIGEASIVVAMRFHAAIVATLAGRPSVLVGYSPKVYSLGESLGESCSIIPFESGAFEKIPELVVDLLQRKPDVRAKRAKLILAFNTNKVALSRYIGKP